MIQKLDRSKILWFLVAFLSLVAALMGMLDPGIYSRVVVPISLYSLRLTIKDH
jgi:hypothetical protein